MAASSQGMHRLATRRSQHLVFLAHVWACAPFMVLWLRDPVIHQSLGDTAITALRPYVGLILGYLSIRTWLALRDPKWLRWEYVFPPLDVLLISTILYVSHRGPLSNLTLLFFLPIIQASGSLNVRWAASVGAMVVVGTILATLNVSGPPPDVASMPDVAYQGTRELFQHDPLNGIFRIYFMILMSSLMTYQALIAAEYRARAGVEEDRNRIALEMHDGVQGSLIALAAQLELISHVASQDGERAGELAKEARETTREATDELRFLVQRLRGPALEKGFVAALRQYADNICGRYQLGLEFEVQGEPANLPAEAEHTLFRIAQETLHNVVKHAQASLVVMRVTYKYGGLELEIQDNGKGFDTNLACSGSVGLVGMKERSKAAGGSLEIASQPGVGTTIRASFAS